MKKLDFIFDLHNRLENLPQDDVEERLHFYIEMIEDHMEEGLSEEEAVAQLGSIEEIAAQIIQDIPLAKLVKERMKPQKRLKAGETALLIAGSPMWLPLLIAMGAVVISLYISLWAVLISFWAVFVSCAICAVSCIPIGMFFCFQNGLMGAAVISAGLVCAGLSIFLLFGCKAATKGVLLLTKKMILRIKYGFAGKERASA